MQTAILIRSPECYTANHSCELQAKMLFNIQFYCLGCRNGVYLNMGKCYWRHLPIVQATAASAIFFVWKQLFYLWIWFKLLSFAEQRQDNILRSGNILAILACSTGCMKTLYLINWKMHTANTLITFSMIMLQHLLYFSNCYNS